MHPNSANSVLIESNPPSTEPEPESESHTQSILLHSTHDSLDNGWQSPSPLPRSFLPPEQDDDAQHKQQHSSSTATPVPSLTTTTSTTNANVLGPPSTSSQTLHHALLRSRMRSTRPPSLAELTRFLKNQNKEIKSTSTTTIQVTAPSPTSPPEEPPTTTNETTPPTPVTRPQLLNSLSHSLSRRQQKLNLPHPESQPVDTTLAPFEEVASTSTDDQSGSTTFPNAQHGKSENEDEGIKVVGEEITSKGHRKRPSLKILEERVAGAVERDRSKVVKEPVGEELNVENPEGVEITAEEEKQEGLVPSGVVVEMEKREDLVEEEASEKEASETRELGTIIETSSSGSSQSTPSPHSDSTISPRSSSPMPPPATSSTLDSDPPSTTSTPAHPLQHKWTFLFQHIRVSNQEEAKLNHATVIGLANTVEDFCRLFNWVKRPSQLRLGNAVCVFKDDIQPFVDDPSNLKGGRWTLTLRGGDPEKFLLDKVWIFLVLSLVGEELDESDQVTGALMHAIAPTEALIQIWTRTTTPVSSINSLGVRLSKILEFRLAPGVSFVFSPHHPAPTTTSTDENVETTIPISSSTTVDSSIPPLTYFTINNPPLLKTSSTTKHLVPIQTSFAHSKSTPNPNSSRPPSSVSTLPSNSPFSGYPKHSASSYSTASSPAVSLAPNPGGSFQRRSSMTSVTSEGGGGVSVSHKRSTSSISVGRQSAVSPAVGGSGVEAGVHPRPWMAGNWRQGAGAAAVVGGGGGIQGGALGSAIKSVAEKGARRGNSPTSAGGAVAGEALVKEDRKKENC